MNEPIPIPPPVAFPVLPFGDPVIYPALRGIPCQVQAENGISSEERIYLMRNTVNAEMAYRKVPNRKPLLLQDRGKLIDCQLLQRVASSTGVVYQETTNYVKVKKMRKEILERMRTEGHPEVVQHEIFVLQNYGDGTHVAEIHEALDDERYIYIVMPWYRDGSLYDSVPRGGFSMGTYDPRPLLARLATNLFHIHTTAELVHRDVSPENILMDGGVCVYTDFAMALRLSTLEGRAQYVVPQRPCGKLPYMAPEIILQRPFGQPIDVWCLGGVFFFCMTGMHLYQQPGDRFFQHFLMLGGLSPRNEQVNRNAEESILINPGGEQDPLVLRIHAVRRLSSSLRDLLVRMFCLRPEERISVQEITSAEWFRQDNF